MSGPVVSVVTVTYRDPDGLAQTLASLAAQDLPRECFEVVVVDGGCDAATAALLADPPLPVRATSEPDDGVYDAMNKGWRAARGRYLHFLNAGDTLLRADALSSMAAAVAAAPTPPVWVVCGARHFHGGAAPASTIPNLPHDWAAHARGVQPHCHQACWFAAAVVADLGGYDERFDFVADFDLVLRTGRIAAPLEVDAELVGYEGGGMSARRAREIPGLLHRVRVERLGLRGPARVADACRVAAQRSRRWAGRRRRALRAALRTPGDVRRAA